MEYLNFSSISFGSEFEMRLVFTKLNNNIRAGTWFDSFTVQNTKWFSLVKNIVAALNSDRVMCGVFGLYPSNVGGILKRVEEINVYVLCNYKLKYIEKEI
jgi:hypothetical protein